MQLQSVIIHNLQFDKRIYAYIRNMNNKMLKRVLENNSTTIISINNERKKSFLQKIIGIFNKIYISITYDNLNKNVVFHLDCLLKSDINNISYYEYLDDSTLIKVEHIRQSNNKKSYDVIIHISKSKGNTSHNISRNSSYNDLDISVHSNKSCESVTSPEKQRRYSKKYFPINADQATYLESRSERQSRSSNNSSVKIIEKI